MGRTPKEDPQDKAARLRERRMATLERDRATQQTAGDLTADLRAVYGLRGIPLKFGKFGTAPASTGPFGAITGIMQSRVPAPTPAPMPMASRLLK